MNDKNPSNLFRTLQHKKLFYSLKMYEEERLTLRLSKCNIMGEKQLNGYLLSNVFLSNYQNMNIYLSFEILIFKS